MTTINQYDRMNDPELGSGIYDRTSFIEQFRTAFHRLQDLDPDWEEWYDNRPEQTTGEMLPLIEERIIWLENAMETLVRDTKAGVNVDGFLSLMDVCNFRNAAEEHAALLMECPWMDDDLGESPTDLRTLYGYG